MKFFKVFVCNYTPTNPKTTMTTTMSSITIRVDRSSVSTYPEYFKKPKYPSLRGLGPVVYTLDTLQIQPSVVKSLVSMGHPVCRELEKNNNLGDCLSSDDLFAIKVSIEAAGGVQTFREFYGEQELCAWRSVGIDVNGNPVVPCLREGKGELQLTLHFLDSLWVVEWVTVRFGEVTPSTQKA